jgi:hypothetical protein
MQVQEEAVQAGLAAACAPQDACSVDDLVRLLAVMASVGGEGVCGALPRFRVVVGEWGGGAQ